LEFSVTVETAKEQVSGELPPIAGQFSGALLILGGARCVWDDVRSLPGGDLALEKWPGDIMATNDIGAHVHQFIRHWTTLHEDYMAGWHAYRYGHNHGGRGHVYTHGIRANPAIHFVWNLKIPAGNSGLFAARIALLMGYDRVVLAGVPMDGQGHFFDPPWVGHGHFGAAELEEWKSARDEFFANRVRSLSGRTRDLLGAPA
jgi:hypothetical protein